MKKAIAGGLLAALSLVTTSAFSEEAAADASREWRALVEPLAPIGEHAVQSMRHPADAQLRQEMYRALFAQIAHGYFQLAYADAEHPDFWPWFNVAFNGLAPNPDASYYVALVDSDGVYRISGYRGSVKRLMFQTGNGTFVTRGVMDENVTGRDTGNLDVDDLKLGKDGAFEFVLSAKRPAGYKGHWWPLTPDTTHVFVRQISYDWLHEVDGRVAIERLDRPAVKPRPSAGHLAAGLKQIAVYAEQTTRFGPAMMNNIRNKVGINRAGFFDMKDYGQMLTQKVGWGTFELAPDEALLVEVQPGRDCRYWSYQLVDDSLFSIDWMNRQTSLNGFTGRVDKDGVFRMVISARDPGVANWLDNAGYPAGGMQIRWERCSSYPTEHVSRVVKVDEVRKYLPADTPLVTAEARDAAIRLRRKGAQLRKRW